MRIVMAEHFPLDHPLRVGSHHLCRLFVERGHEVFWLADPVHLPKNPLRFLTDPVWRADFDRCRQGVIRHEGALGLTPFTWLPWVGLPGLGGPRGPWRSLGACRPDPLALLDAHGFGRPDLLWLTFPRWAALADRLPHGTLVHRITDDYEAAAAFPPAIGAVEPALAARADLVLCASRTMTERAGVWNERVHYMPNGVRWEDFRGDFSRPSAMERPAGPRILYVGGVDRSRIDLDWMNALLRALPEAQVYLVGPGDLDPSHFGHAPNLHLVGLRPYAEIPAWMAHADVGLLPLPDEAFARAVNPLKILQYCAAGLPAVARDLPETRNLGAPVALASTAEDFVSAVKAQLRDGGSTEELRDFARERSWSAWMDRLEALLAEGRTPRAGSAGSDPRRPGA